MTARTAPGMFPNVSGLFSFPASGWFFAASKKHGAYIDTIAQKPF